MFSGPLHRDGRRLWCFAFHRIAVFVRDVVFVRRDVMQKSWLTRGNACVSSAPWEPEQAQFLSVCRALIR